MISTRTFGGIVLGQLVLIAGCSSSGDPNAGGSSTVTGGVVNTGTGGDPGPCGGEAQKCCSTGALCQAGLTCSDEFCLVCGPPPASFMGCTNVAAGQPATATTAPGAMPDDPAKVVDNDICTSWNYGNFGEPAANWQVDLGTVQTLESLTLWPKMTPGDGEVSFRLQFKAAEADAFSDYPSSSGLTLTLHDYHPWQTTFSPPISARYFRVSIVSGPSYAALREVGLYTGCSQ
jgi:F5/8 type C domain